MNKKYVPYKNKNIIKLKKCNKNPGCSFQKSHDMKIIIKARLYEHGRRKIRKIVSYLGRKTRK